MQKMLYYLVVWGSGADQVRHGTGENEAVAAKYAFGMYDPKLMSLRQLSLYDMRTESRRTLHAYKLLLEHAGKMTSQGEHQASKAAIRVAEGLKKYRQKDWARLKNAA